MDNMFPPDLNKDTVDQEAGLEIELTPMIQPVPGPSISKSSQWIEEADIRRIIEQLYPDNRGLVEINEIKATIGHEQADEIERTLRLADEDNDGRLSYDEFLKIVKSNQCILKRMSTNIAHQPVEKRRKHWPIVILVVSGLQVGIHIYNCYTKNSLVNCLQFNPATMIQVWRFVTYMLIHLGIGHLCGNIALQLLVGISLEMHHGSCRILAVYLSGGVAGCLGHALIQLPHPNLSGASAGDYALVGACLASVIINWRELEDGLVRIYCGVTYIIISFVMAATDTEQTVSHYAHFFGGLAGLLVGFGVLQNWNNKKWVNLLRNISWAVFAVLMLIGVVCLLALT